MPISVRLAIAISIIAPGIIRSSHKHLFASTYDYRMLQPGEPSTVVPTSDLTITKHLSLHSTALHQTVPQSYAPVPLELGWNERGWTL
jgi:hypothetical protein